LTYRAGSAGQTLNVRWMMTSGTGNVTLNAAALDGPTETGTVSATAETPQHTVINTPFAAPLQAPVRDGSSNTVIGVTVKK